TPGARSPRPLYSHTSKNRSELLRCAHLGDLQLRMMRCWRRMRFSSASFVRQTTTGVQTAKLCQQLDRRSLHYHILSRFGTPHLVFGRSNLSGTTTFLSPDWKTYKPFRWILQWIRSYCQMLWI